MEKELKIKVKINSNFEIDATPNLNDWDKASVDSKNEYVKERVKEFLLNQIDDIIDELLDSSKIEF